MKTRSKYISWPLISAHGAAGMVGFVSPTKAIRFSLRIFTGKTSKYCMLSSKSLCVSRREPESAYDLLQILTRPRNVFISQNACDSV
jgi:hypothetical protein